MKKTFDFAWSSGARLAAHSLAVVHDLDHDLLRAVGAAYALEGKLQLDRGSVSVPGIAESFTDDLFRVLEVRPLYSPRFGERGWRGTGQGPERSALLTEPHPRVRCANGGDERVSNSVARRPGLRFQASTRSAISGALTRIRSNVLAAAVLPRLPCSPSADRLVRYVDSPRKLHLG